MQHSQNVAHETACRMFQKHRKYTYVTRCIINEILSVVQN